VHYAVVGKQPNSKMCLVCGLQNPSGLKASFYETDSKEVIAVFKPLEAHQSYPGRLHGGLATAVIDETIGRAIRIGHDKEVWSVTVELKTRFKKPIPLDGELRVIGRVTHEGNRFFEGTAELVLANGEVAATGQGRYLKLGLDQIGDFDYEENDWRVTPGAADPKGIEL
jgi:uncharacterized protein (TIGR00369 family)